MSKFELKRVNERWWQATLSSGDGEDDKGCALRFTGFGWWLSIPLPPVIKPYRHWVDTSKYEWSGPNGGYWDTDRREFGVSLFDNHFSVRYGRQADDSSIDRQWGTFVPWMDWRFVRMSYYGIDGEHVWTEPHRTGPESNEQWEERQSKIKAVPTVTFDFTDFDGEAIQATTRIKEWQWKFGTGWFRWLSLFRRDKVRRSLDLHFSKETGKRKGSWKGGTIGHSIDMLPGELHEAAFRRYCAENAMTFVGVAEARSVPT